jgi:hypothetical protein
MGDYEGNGGRYLALERSEDESLGITWIGEIEASPVHG